MPQTVNITITGLCLFVHGDDGQMYVLLPATGSAGDGSVEPHRPLLRFAAGTVKRGAGETMELDGLEVRFEMDAGPVDPTFVRGVVDLRRYTGAGVPSHLFTDDGSGVLSARIAFPSGSMHAAGTPSYWTMRRPGSRHEERVEFTNQATWTAVIPDGAGPLVLRGGPLGSGANAPLVAFRRDVPVISIFLSHDVDHAHCSVPPIGSENEHYQAYRWLLEDSAEWHLPRFAGLSASPAGGGVFAHGGVPFKCMLGGVEPAPTPPLPGA